MMKKGILLFNLLMLGVLFASAQTSDSIMAAHLRGRGINITDGNSVTLLKTGHDKFEDLLE
jgi:cardiolipin synthase